MKSLSGILTTPTWAHRCDACRFLGQTITGEDKVTDLYACTPHGLPVSLLARWGSGPHDRVYAAPQNCKASGQAELFVAAYLWANQ